MRFRVSYGRREPSRLNVPRSVMTEGTCPGCPGTLKPRAGTGRRRGSRVPTGPRKPGKLGLPESLRHNKAPCFFPALLQVSPCSSPLCGSPPPSPSPPLPLFFHPSFYLSANASPRLLRRCVCRPRRSSCRRAAQKCPKIAPLFPPQTSCEALIVPSLLYQSLPPPFVPPRFLPPTRFRAPSALRLLYSFLAVVDGHLPPSPSPPSAD